MSTSVSIQFTLLATSVLHILWKQLHDILQGCGGRFLKLDGPDEIKPVPQSDKTSLGIIH